LTSNEIRRKFLDYFAARGHRVVKSSSLVPANDPTLLFTNAGMNQFKDVFLGLEQREYRRAASSQKCVRAGGKHNDLETVGRTRRHLTFFEMLGNFSFGDYFKKEAIEYAWELVTREFSLPIDKLYVTVFRDDDDAFHLWTRDVGVQPERVFRMDEKDNFWAMGETGPCGPCSEIYYDLGPNASTQGHTDCAFPCDCDRYVEIWNLVFMQFNRDAGGELSPLPKPSIDTGMGLERTTSVIQGKLSVFETDLLWPLIEEAALMSGMAYGEKPESDVSLRILSDHSRCAAFLIHDGVLPANDGRGYVLRKILRRAIRHGRLLGMDRPFLYQLTGRVAEIMSDAYPELLESAERVAAVVKSEEQRFAHTMSVALGGFDDLTMKMARDVVRWHSQGTEGMAREIFRQRSQELEKAGFGEEARRRLQETEAVRRIVLPGNELFRLYDTFGMPLDWIKEIAAERGMEVDEAGFDQEMQRQRERARASWKGAEKSVLSPAYADVLAKGRTVFEGYQQTVSQDCVVVGLIVVPDKGSKGEPKFVEEVAAGTRVEMVLDHTPFYAESGGQVGDAGVLLREGSAEEGAQVAAVVEDTFSPVSGIVAHRILTREPIRLGDRLKAMVDVVRRAEIRRNHTATHLLHAALRQVLGPHVKQAGSVVEPSRLRFDFSHFTSVGESELEEIEYLANAEVLKNTPVETNVMELDKAIQTGAMAFFGEKYGERVRVVSVEGFSKELCGGTHVSRTGDIGLVKITSEGGISAGVRRIEAVTGSGALKEFQAVTSMVQRTAETLKISTGDLPQAVEKLAESERNLAKQADALKLKIAQAQIEGAEGRARTVKDVKVLAVRLDGLERGQMRTLADVLRSRLKSGVVVLGAVPEGEQGGKVAVIAALTPDLTKRLHAGKIAQAVAQRLGGSGGGRPDIAEAGGKNATMLDEVLEQVYEIVGGML